METTDTIRKADTSEKRNGMLYPAMLIAAIAVTIFSAVGIATMTGMIPNAGSGSEPAAAEDTPKRALPATTPSAKPGTARVVPSGSVSAAGACPDCGVVESIRAVEVKGQGTGLGAVAGGVIGGILGNQVGGGRGRTAMTVVGAGGGAYAGHEIEKNVNKSVNYQIRVRMNDGTYRTFYERAQPALAVGQKVRVTSGVVAAAG
ncbi:MAG: glycine zipper 2TM domain-containing protein [Betaproteobacteria bacterium]|nr:glycine zipper 2TM domain-containing protein [Betaproteobacteria bacterium]